MRSNKLTGLLIVGAMTLGVGVAAAATGALGSDAVFGIPTEFLMATNDAVVAPRDVDIPPERQLVMAHMYLTKIDQNATSVRALLEQARAARDVVKTLCLNDKLNQLDVANRAAKDRAGSLEGAATSKDRDRGRHEFVMLQGLNDRCDQIVKEAHQCIGEETGFVGESQVSLEIDPNIPQDNVDDLGPDHTIFSEPPVLGYPNVVSPVL